MATKKLARAKKPSPAESVKSAAVKETPAAVARKVVWTMPIVMLMLIVAAGGLLIASRESSNATPAETAATPVMAPSSTGGVKSAPVAANASAETTVASAPATPATASAKPVSITGCLQRSDERFVLKNTEGAAAPKSRSWKSGFLKRSTASIDLSDANNTAHLGSHVGQRVTVTGPLADRDMRVQSLRRVAATCG